MRAQITKHPMGRSKPTTGYTIFDDDGKAVASGFGFATERYLNQAITMRMRALRGLRPLPVYPQHAKEATMAIVESWNDEIYGKHTK